MIPSLPPAAQTVPARAPSDSVSIGVLSLFHPRQLTVSAPAGQALIVRTDEVRAGEESIVLERSTGVESANIRISTDGLLVTAGPRSIRASALTVTGRENEPVEFVLAVPEKITRHYRGTLAIKPSSGTLLAIITMDRETAVASVVAAESTADTPLEALKAQAVAARSYFAASRGRHHDFDFCDTTHCQFLREPPAPDSPAAAAVAATRDLVLAYNSQAIAAMYTRSCSGRTRTPAELGLPSAAYPYFSVECKYCRAHPVRWVSRISAQDAASLHSSDEAARLNLVRRLGWAAVPSNDFVVEEERDQVFLKGTGQGHGIGLCQAGAKAMAQEGADFRQILSHYYPNTTIVNLPAASASF
ncbi:MAG: SpoIID/LytB domain-containing protein [Candidatus Sulfotelmatobacter sp.]